jgi:hypothetical protein
MNLFGLNPLEKLGTSMEDVAQGANFIRDLPKLLERWGEFQEKLARDLNRLVEQGDRVETMIAQIHCAVVTPVITEELDKALSEALHEDPRDIVQVKFRKECDAPRDPRGRDYVMPDC